MKKKAFIAPDDIKKGYKRINITLSISDAQRLEKVTRTKGVSKPTTLAGQYVRHGIARDDRQQDENHELPGQVNLFEKQKGNKKS